MAFRDVEKIKVNVSNLGELLGAVALVVPNSKNIPVHAKQQVRTDS
jgi:hypothetical protein